MYFELWDLETRNLLCDFDTLEEAIEAARELTELSPDVYPDKLALFRYEGDTNSSWIARGEDLLRLTNHRASE